MKIPAPIVIFTRPLAPGNLGALARVMSNFGSFELRYVGKFPVPVDAHPSGFAVMDWAMARKGEDILKNAKEFATLRAALEGIQLAIGSSGRDREFEGGYARPHVGPEQALATCAEWAEKSRQAPADFRWAFVLGPEADGLSEQEAALCQQLVRLPTVDEAPSMNVAMAAGCFLYHWHLVNIGLATLSPSAPTGPFVTPPGEKIAWADGVQTERFADYLMEVLALTKFLKYPDTENIKARVRRWLQATPIPLTELLFGFEIVYQLRSWGTGKFAARNFLDKK
ncbi:MAG: RNA methyltransferase [Bdellovibrionales bacterium]|nr:RNA methyltransferase [Bdellovibrionales bacterium]